MLESFICFGICCQRSAAKADVVLTCFIEVNITVTGGQRTRTRNLRVTNQRLKPLGHAAFLIYDKMDSDNDSGSYYDNEM